MSLDAIREVGPSNFWLSVVATTRPDGSVHASLVNAGVMDDPDGGGEIVAFVARGSAAKVAHITRTGRASLTFTAAWRWAGIEGPARVAGSDPQLLRDVFRAAGGSHDDWDEYDRVMASEGRVAVFVRPERVLVPR